MRRLPLQSIEAFVVVAKSLSLAKASLSMNLTVPALSRRIQILEHHLGVQLFRRPPRGLSLTDAGTEYFRALAASWNTISEATEAARKRTTRRTIKVSVMPTFAANWLMPRLNRFQSQHPEIEVELETSSDLIDLRLRPDLDCAIRLGRGPWTGLTCETFLPVDAYPVASPDFVSDNAPLRHPGDVVRHALIGSHHQPDFWREWFDGFDLDAAECRYRSFDNLQVAYEAAAANMGIAIGIGPVVQPYLSSGRLKKLFPTDVRLSSTFHLVRRQDDTMQDRPFQIFREWLFAEAKTHARPGE
jgi:LysR family transcriptional regulator, glycine cleavage system transcriptional activator